MDHVVHFSLKVSRSGVEVMFLVFIHVAFCMLVGPLSSKFHRKYGFCDTSIKFGTIVERLILK